jgi:hypothetical protein
MNETGNIKRAVMRENIGTVVSWEDEKNEWTCWFNFSRCWR